MKRAILATPTKYGVAGITAVAPGAVTITATYGDQTYEWGATVEEKPEVAPPVTNNTDTTEPTDGEATDIAAPNTGAEMPSVLMVIAGCVVAILAAAYSAKYAACVS